MYTPTSIADEFSTLAPVAKQVNRKYRPGSVCGKLTCCHNVVEVDKVRLRYETMVAQTGSSQTMMLALAQAWCAFSWATFSTPSDEITVMMPTSSVTNC
jgi:hypothetical protein